jgi:rhodanese-related sulfurtransferase
VADEITVDELAQHHAQGPIALIDVRELDEYTAAHVPGARLVPLGTVPDAVETLPADERLYVICHSGARSQRAADYLLARGFDAVSVAGGTSAWVQRGLDYETGERP